MALLGTFALFFSFLACKVILTFICSITIPSILYITHAFTTLLRHKISDTGVRLFHNNSAFLIGGSIDKWLFNRISIAANRVVIVVVLQDLVK